MGKYGEVRPRPPVHPKWVPSRHGTLGSQHDGANQRHGYLSDAALGADDLGTQRAWVACLGSRGGPEGRGFRGPPRSGIEPSRPGLSPDAPSGQLFVCPPQRSRGQHPSVSAGHVKKPDLQVHLNESKVAEAAAQLPARTKSWMVGLKKRRRALPYRPIRSGAASASLSWTRLDLASADHWSR